MLGASCGSSAMPARRVASRLVTSNPICAFVQDATASALHRQSGATRCSASKRQSFLCRDRCQFADWHPRLSRRRPGLCADRSRPSAMRSYAATLANELTHSTKHSARLARDLGRIQRRIGPPLSVARPGRAAPRPGDAGRATAGAVRLARRSPTRRRARRRGLSRAEPVQRAGA